MNKARICVVSICCFLAVVILYMVNVRGKVKVVVNMVASNRSRLCLGRSESMISYQNFRRVQPMATNFRLSEKCKELSQSVYRQGDLERMCDEGLRETHGMERFCLVAHPELYYFPEVSTSFHVRVPSQKVSQWVHMYTYSSADMISAELLKGKVWERDLVDAVTDALSRYSRAHFIDIGSNLGVLSLTVALGTNRRVFALDANYNNAIRLGRTLMENGVLHKVSLFWNAIHDSSDKTFISYREEGGTCHIGAAITGRSKPNPESPHTNNMQDVTATVNSSRIDDFLPYIKCLMTEAVIKIDIEGAEWIFFKSSHKLFDSLRVHYVFMEWLNFSNQQKSLITNFLTQRKFKPLALGMRPMQPSQLLTGSFGTVVWMREMI